MGLIDCMKSLPVKVVVAALVVIAIFTGCSEKNTEPFRDGPRSDVVNDNKSDIIEFPDGFSNAATKCDHGNRVYVVFKGDNTYGSIAVSPQDPSCPQIGTASSVDR